MYDLAGNVSEWTADWYDATYYQQSPKRNPKGPLRGNEKVFRGGSWFNAYKTLRSANRRWKSPGRRTAIIGIRCAQDAPKTIPMKTEGGQP